jgi:hypothetical protein
MLKDQSSFFILVGAAPHLFVEDEIQRRSPKLRGKE